MDARQKLDVALQHPSQLSVAEWSVLALQAIGAITTLMAENIMLKEELERIKESK